MGSAEALGGLCKDRLAHAVWVGSHLAIPEADDSPTVCHKKIGPLRIIDRSVEMLASIQLNPKLC
ncbi:hypothetical protein KC8_12430 [Sphingomonas sp. KC8]|nr:hypothetical protein KC8_12430 [Sphingomonas sp. KC8]